MPSTPRDESGWTIETYAATNDARWNMQARLDEERDRRYREVDEARAEALRVKEEANREALRLARASQDYRDERDNKLREQLNMERGSYATLGDLKAFQERYEASHKPLADYVAAQIGRRQGIQAATGALYAILVVLVALAALSIAHYDTSRTNHKTPTVTVTVPTK